MFKNFLKFNRNTIYKSFETKIGYKFRSKKLLSTALTHCSVTDDVHSNYERLEFLGDSVLSCIFAEYFFKENFDSEQGVLAQNKSIITRGKTLSEIAKHIGLNEIVITSGEDVLDENGEIRKSILEDTLEAIIGAIFLEQKYDKTKKIILPWFGDIKTETEKIKLNFNPKGKLQELLQSEKPRPTIEYIVSKETWRNQKKYFFIDLLVNSQKKSSGDGTSKKEAEEKAAQEYLERHNKN